MKKYKIVMVIVATLIFSGCDDRLETTPYSVITSASMWKSESDAVSGVIGMYSQFRTTLNNDRAFFFLFELRSGFWKFGTSGGSSGTIGWQDLMSNTLDFSTTAGTDWSTFYRTIGAANLAIKYIPTITFNDKNKQNNLLADAYFVRAFCYFTLARVFGNVPLVLLPYESADDENLFPARVDVELIFDQIKTDIDLALNNMVDTGVRDRIMTSRAGINMLKADVYLWTAKRLNGGTADLEVAEAAVNQVLASPNYQLLNSYEQVFRLDQNAEIIFSLYFDALENATQYGRDFLYSPVQVPAENNNNPIPIGGNNHWLTFTDSYVDNYLSPDDTRSGVNNQDVVGVNGVKYRWVNKYIGDWVDGTRLFVNDTRIYRYAEAILFKAEILNGLGKTSEAITELNKIAKRAYEVDDFYSASLSQSEVNDAILRERLIEFGAEGKSWFDIVRFGKAFELIPTLVGRENDYQGNILVLPVSPDIITRNPNIIQTPGF